MSNTRCVPPLLSKSPTGREARKAPRGRLRPQLTVLEDRTVPTTFRTIDGTDNNPFHPERGSAGSNLLRTAPAAYADGIDNPTVGNPTRPSPRTISNVIVAQTTEERIVSDRFMSAMIYGWGQFLDHDIDLTPNASPAVPFNIVVPDNPADPFSR